MTQVAPGWHPDPLRRHPLRYWDGDAWTAYVSAGGSPFRDPLGMEAPPPGQAATEAGPVPPAYVAYAAVSTPVPPAGGLLLAAGVIALVEGAFTALSVLAVAAVTSGSNNGALGFAGGALAIVAVILVALTALFITAGVGGVRRTAWGRTLLIVSNSLLLLLAVLATARSREFAGVLFWLAVGGTGLCLALAGKPREAMSATDAVPAALVPPTVQVLPPGELAPPPEPAVEPPPSTTGFSAIE